MKPRVKKPHPLSKQDRLQVRLSARERADVQRAAAWVSQQRDVIVPEGTLLREVAMPRIREILQQAEQLEPAA